MGVRVNMLLRRADGATLTSSVLLNSGFESDEPHILLPRCAAERLFPVLPPGTKAQTIGTAGGDAQILVPSEKIFARVLVEDQRGPEIPVCVFISDEEVEILVSDTAIDALGVEIKSPGKGLWKFAGEEEIHSSSPPQEWK